MDPMGYKVIQCLHFRGFEAGFSFYKPVCPIKGQTNMYPNIQGGWWNLKYWISCKRRTCCIWEHHVEVASVFIEMGEKSMHTKDWISHWKYGKRPPMWCSICSRRSKKVELETDFLGNVWCPQELWLPLKPEKQSAFFVISELWLVNLHPRKVPRPWQALINHWFPLIRLY